MARNKNPVVLEKNREKQRERYKKMKAQSQLGAEIPLIRRQHQLEKERVNQQLTSSHQRTLELQNALEEEQENTRSHQKGSDNLRMSLGLQPGEDPKMVRELLGVLRWRNGKKRGKLISPHYGKKLMNHISKLPRERTYKPFSNLEERQKRRRMEFFGKEIQEM